MSTTIRVNFNTVLIRDPSAKWAIYFKNANGNVFGTISAILVEDISNIPQSGFISSSTSGDNDNSVEFTYDYDNNSQGGRTPATDAEIVIVAIGINIAKYVRLDATIKDQAVNNFILAAEEELYYA